MADRQEGDTELAEVANERYWNSDASVNHIADELGQSKSRLYGMIRQLATGLACPECRSGLVFSNRTARDRGLMACTACEFEGTGDGLDPVVEAPEVDGSSGAAPTATTAGSGSTRALAGAALLGLAAGFLIGSAARR